MTLASKSYRKLKTAGLVGPMAAMALLALTGCQALDRPAGANRNGYDPRDNTQPTPPRLTDVPKPLTTEEQAIILRNQGLNEQALQAFERAIEENPLATISYVNAGDLYFQKGDIVTAQKRFEAAATIDPSNFEANYMNGLMLQLSRRVGEAVSAYLKALQINPYDFKANLNTGTAYLQLKEPQQAVIFSERAVDLRKQDASARANLGAVYAALGRHAEAVAQYREAAQLEELSPPLLLNLANSLGKMKPPQFAQMLNTLDQLIRTDPSAIAYERRAYALFKLNRRDDSLAACREALSLDEKHYPAWNIIGVIRINDWLEGGSNDEKVHQEALNAWRTSLRIEVNQATIRDLITQYQ